MATEEDVLAAPTPTSVPSDHKRKLQDLEQPQEHHEEEEAPHTESNPNNQLDNDTEPDADIKAGAVLAEPDSPDLKRAKLDEPKHGELASENGFEGNKADDDVKKGELEPGAVENEQAKDDVRNDELPLPEEGQEPVDKEGDFARDGNVMNDAEIVSLEKDKPLDEETEKPSQDEEEVPVSDGQTTSRKMEVPNDKVGVLIGKGGDTIRYLQYNSGAKIQITRDAEANPHSATRPVEIIGTISSISKAEKLILAVIAEADAGGSPSLVARGMASAQSTGVAEQLEMQVPNEKVGLIIGRGGDTIKSLQAKSGARIQVLIPQHLPEGDGSKERTVRVTGDQKQIEIAREMIVDVMNQTVRPSSLSSGFNQQHSHRTRGPSGPGHWGPRGPHSSHGMPYDYPHRGPYPSQNSQYPPPHYGNYPPQQMAPRGNFGSSWEQRPPSAMQGPHSHGGAYDYYGGHGSNHPVSAPISTPIPGHASGPSPAPVMGPPQSQANYNHGQPHGSDYAHQAPYSQTVPHQQSYGHGYDEPKYDNAPIQHLYGHGSSQPVYPQAGNQLGYGAQQQYGKQPAYGMPAQGPPLQSQGPPRPGLPGDVPYPGAIQSSQSYGPNVPQPQYPYASSGPMQQSYPPYGSDGYSQATPASGTGYPQQSTHSVPAYGQAGGQQAAGYVQGAAGGYGSYPSAQQGYPEQPAANNAGYGYQGPQDPAYGSGTATAYVAPSGQQGYTQPAPAQQSYDQSVTQSGGYGAASGSAPASYGKTVSPQPAYPQYDSTQMYSAPR